MYKILAIFVWSCLVSVIFCAAFAPQQSSSAAADATMKKAQEIPESESYRSAKACSKGGVAVGGYDLVSYRREGGPRFGSAEFSVQYGGDIFLFENVENRETFLSAPNQYLPNYGGWCAISMALGAQTCPDYGNFKIENGDLLLFEVTAFTNGRALWNTDPPKYRTKADVHYQQLMQE